MEPSSPASWTLSLAITLLLTWLISTHLSTTAFPSLRNKRIVLLIAHPDDEAMFFSPTVQALAAPSTGNHVKILCLSTGNAAGLGATRRTELVRSAALLGLRHAPADVLVLDDPRFQDSMTAAWDPAAIAALLETTFVSGGTPAVDALVTFDAGGVSGHPNHVALYHGARAFVRARGGAAVKMYVLPSTGVVRKYASIADVPVTVLRSLLRRKTGGEFPDPLVFVGGAGTYRRGQRAMTEAHVSQMRWFRWGWIAVSRYMVVNDLQREII